MAISVDLRDYGVFGESICTPRMKHKKCDVPQWYYFVIMDAKHIDDFLRILLSVLDTMNGNSHHTAVCTCLFVVCGCDSYFVSDLPKHMMLGGIVIIFETKKKKLFILSQKICYSMINNILIKI